MFKINQKKNFVAGVNLTNKKVLSRCSHPEMLYKNRVLKYLVDITGKHLYRSIFLNKCASCRPETFLKTSEQPFYRTSKNVCLRFR